MAHAHQEAITCLLLQYRNYWSAVLLVSYLDLIGNARGVKHILEGVLVGAGCMRYHDLLLVQYEWPMAACADLSSSLEDCH